MHSKSLLKERQPPHANPLNPATGFLKASYKFMRNPIEGMSANVYTQDHSVHRTFFVDMHVLSGPDAVYEVLVKQHKDFRKSELNQRILTPFTAQGLIVAHDAKWKRQRKAVAPVFQHRNIKKLHATFSATVTKFLDTMPAYEHVSDLGNLMSNLSFEILADSVLGDPRIDRSVIRKAAFDMVSATGKLRIDDFLPLPKKLPRVLSIRAYKAKQKLRRSAEALLKQTQSEGGGFKARKNLVSLLRSASSLEPSGGLSFVEQRDNVIGFYIAGHETTALALTWACYLIAQNQNIQERLHAEISAPELSEPITFEELGGLKLLNAVIYETMRLYPSIPIIGREAKCDVEIQGRVIKKDEIVIVPIYVMHRSHAHWERPNDFEPDRFIREPELARGSKKYIPFGTGPRVCIGASFAMVEMRTALTAILKKYNMTVSRECRPKPLVTASLRPSHSIPITFEPRAIT